jgi:hypothetical protein
MFIVTAQTVKPVNRVTITRIPAVENLKNGSLLGIEPKEGAKVTGPTGFMITAADNNSVPATSTAPASVETQDC